jgi:hypothetical protein
MNGEIDPNCGGGPYSQIVTTEEPLPLGIVRVTDLDGNVFEAWDGEIYEEAVMDAIAARILGNRRRTRIRSRPEPAES